MSDTPIKIETEENTRNVVDVGKLPPVGQGVTPEFDKVPPPRASLFTKDGENQSDPDSDHESVNSQNTTKLTPRDPRDSRDRNTPKSKKPMGYPKAPTDFNMFADPRRMSSKMNKNSDDESEDDDDEEEHTADISINTNTTTINSSSSSTASNHSIFCFCYS